ncbi:Hsp20/alpha crystallin family protein [Paenibacillus sp. KQZ6P-2]|uniref:Hsp20/alpha crystallin family protein n=1 Tax=Paenibacillus mangrovi TaxID=2931978 RepID=A0A9X2B592_9BACL|nr:Hsp20/alpha crystallin family protein [Paenibacillus mangrovi]MCJ8012422.1 Hsp20/alpha crystallin family protein [Paenibacillus mangrovi]
MSDLIPFNKRTDAFLSSMMKSFNDMFESAGISELGAKSFRTDIRETENAYYIEAELPGFDKKDIQIEMKGQYLTISAIRNDVKEIKNDIEKVIHQERHYGEFIRRFYVDRADEDQIKAKLEHGVLKIVVPKVATAEEGRKRIRIE